VQHDFGVDARGCLGDEWQVAACWRAECQRWKGRVIVWHQETAERNLDLAAVGGAVQQLIKKVSWGEQAREHGFEMRPVQQQVGACLRVAGRGLSLPWAIEVQAFPVAAMLAERSCRAGAVKRVARIFR